MRSCSFRPERRISDNGVKATFLTREDLRKFGLPMEWSDPMRFAQQFRAKLFCNVPVWREFADCMLNLCEGSLARLRLVAYEITPR